MGVAPHAPAGERTLRVLEFPKVIAVLAEGTVTAMGRERALAVRPSADDDEVRAAVAITSEAVLITAEADIPVRGARDIEPLVARTVAGGVIDPPDFLEIAQTLAVAREVRVFLLAKRDRAPRLADVADLLTPLAPVEVAIGRAFDEQGRIKDDASPALHQIRTEIRSVERRLRSALESFIHDSAHSRYLQEPIVTTRGDRFVVPVKAEYRAQVAGLVHDASASGATLFVEPLAVVPLGNRRREMEAAEREEIVRILRQLSEMVAEHAWPLRTNGARLGEIDLACAKAALAARLRSHAPEIRTDGVVDLRGARHPLLVLGRGDAGVVPIDVDLGGAFSTLVITGPNTGGKTVALKTVGLLVLMAQAGLHIPADTGSRVPIFAQVHADIGDEQSIEQNLSTFSSHMRSIVEILDRVEPPALVLLDEVGAGTDPTEGVALARAIIETLHRRGAHTIATTHYNELKMLASTNPGIQNGSVEFDADTLQPTYRLRIGLPGRSNALVIAERLGLDRAIVDDARAHLSPAQVAIEQVLEDLTRERQAAERDRLEAARAREEAEEASLRLNAEADRQRADRRRIMADARREGEALIEEARRRLEAVLAEARAARGEQTARAARAQLREIVESLPAVEPLPPPPGQPVESVMPGLRVFVAPLGRTGVVRGGPDDHDEIEVEVGALRTRVPRASLRALADDQAPPAAAVGAAVVPAAPEVPLSFSVRGETIDEALLAVDRYLDEAVRARLPQVTVIHGKGTGRLRKAIHDFLRGHPHVKQFRLGERGEGDAGATVISLEV
jgi:DNA mismatch repair protein MutS2